MRFLDTLHWNTENQKTIKIYKTLQEPGQKTDDVPENTGRTLYPNRPKPTWINPTGRYTLIIFN